MSRRSFSGEPSQFQNSISVSLYILHYMIQQMVVLHKSIFWTFDVAYAVKQLGDSPVPVSLSNDLPVFLRRLSLFQLPGFYISHRLVRLIVFIEHGDI